MVQIGSNWDYKVSCPGYEAKILNTEYKSAYYSAVMHWSFMKHVLEGARLINYVKI